LHEIVIQVGDKEFEEERKDPFHYEAKPDGKIIFVTLPPIKKMVGSLDVFKL
jgi:hypothetical protein